MLVEAGFDPILSPGGREALDVLASTEVRAVLLDLMMPDIDGFEVLQHMGKTPALRNIPVFVLTAKNLSDAEADLLRRRTHGYFANGTAWKKPPGVTLQPPVRG